MIKNVLDLFFPMRTFLVVSGQKEEDIDVMTANWVMPVSSKEPYFVALAIRPTRFTYKNIKEYREFVISVPSIENLNDIILCGKISKRDTNKLDYTDFLLRKSLEIKTPSIENSLANIECKVEDIRKYGNRYLIVGKVITYDYSVKIDEKEKVLQKHWLKFKNKEDYMGVRNE